MIPLRILIAGLVCLCPFSLAQQLKSDPHKTLIVISTSDIHGNLDNFPRLATLVKQYRAKYPHVLLVDSGDYFMGNPYVDEWDKRGEPLTILMNKLGYDLATSGTMTWITDRRLSAITSRECRTPGSSLPTSIPPPPC